MDYISKTIYGDTWHFYLSAENDNVIIDENSEAETDTETHEVWFRENTFKLSTVYHECFHVFFSYTYTSTAGLDGHQAEEISCELFAYKGKLIQELSEEVFSELKALKEK